MAIEGDVVDHQMVAPADPQVDRAEDLAGGVVDAQIVLELEIGPGAERLGVEAHLGIEARLVVAERQLDLRIEALSADERREGDGEQEQGEKAARCEARAVLRRIGSVHVRFSGWGRV